jgi:tRNA dimethylallyltransferase
MELSLDAIETARAVLIAGPTASGKSALALAFAEEVESAGRRAWIVNADSMQVYDRLRVLTARPSPADEARFTHRLYGHVPAEARYSVGAWLRDVAPVLGEAQAAGALPILVGGTGLYFKALTEGLAAIPDVPAEIRAAWRERIEREGAPRLHALLEERDPVSAAPIRPGDAQRITRALAVLETTGQTLSAWKSARRIPPLLGIGETARFVVEPDRAALYRRIDARFDNMIAKGALAEVEALAERNLDPSLPAMKAIGVREFMAAQRGEITTAAAVERAKMETRRYSKRQTTWFRNQMPEWPRLP